MDLLDILFANPESALPWSIVFIFVIKELCKIISDLIKESKNKKETNDKDFKIKRDDLIKIHTLEERLDNIDLNLNNHLSTLTKDIKGIRKEIGKHSEDLAVIKTSLKNKNQS